MKIKVVNTNNGINSNMQPINIKKSQLLYVYKNDRKNNILIKNSQNPSCDFIQNGKNTKKSSSPFDSKFKNRNKQLPEPQNSKEEHTSQEKKQAFINSINVNNGNNQPVNQSVKRSTINVNTKTQDDDELEI